MYLEKFKSGKNTYIRLVECYRDPNTKTNRKKVIKNYGNYEKLKEQSPEVLRELEEKYSNVKAKENLARNDNFERLVTANNKAVCCNYRKENKNKQIPGKLESHVKARYVWLEFCWYGL